jgi:hypothetical protein
MKNKIDIYSFFSNEITKVLNCSISDYKKYTEFASQPLSDKVYELFVNDIFVFRYSLLYVWIMDYCFKNKIAVIPNQLNFAGGEALGQYFGEQVNNSPDYSKRKAKKELKLIGKKIEKIYQRFWGLRLIVTAKNGRVPDFLQWYTKYIVSKYKVKLYDNSSKSELSKLVLKEAEPLIITITENMQSEFEK